MEDLKKKPVLGNVSLKPEVVYCDFDFFLKFPNV